MKQFSYFDVVFGSQVITEPVIVDLVNSASLRRLEQIDQAGYPEPFFPYLKRHTRFEHSLGVYLLLHRYGASIEEQVAGLIHDVSHAAFSHCVDYVFGDAEGGKTQSHQDNVFEEYVRRSEIPKILASHGLNIDTILDETLFPLKELPLPNLCADRIDYSIRCAVAANVKSTKEIQALLKKLASTGNQWFFEDLSSAREYAELFSYLNATLWCGINSATMFRAVGDCLRYAHQQKYLHHDDFYGTDQTVLEKIKKHLGTDAHLQLLFDRMNNKVPSLSDPSDLQSVVFCKSRVVDPLCMHQGSLQRLSDIDSSWRTRIEKESAPRSYCIRFDQGCSTDVRTMPKPSCSATLSTWS